MRVLYVKVFEMAAYIFFVSQQLRKDSIFVVK